MMVMCNDDVIIEHDERIPGLSNAPAVIKHDNSSIEITEQSTAIASSKHKIKNY